MYLPPLQPISNSHFYVSGNVTIDPNAAIAPGVLFQADPDSRIIIAAGACIGMGAVLHAYQGILEVESGANIGMGVLIVGKGKIGTNACIGSATTILNSSIGWGEVVPPGSLIGDAGRQVAETQRPEPTTIASKSSLDQQVLYENQPAEATTIASESSSNQQVLYENQPAEATTIASESSSNQPASESLGSTPPQVSGQANLNRLLSTLLPHRQSLNRPL